MKNHDFQELVDQNLSGLTWDERKRRKVLRAISEEEKPVRRISKTFVLAAVIICLSVTAALAVGLAFSSRVDNAKLAEEALLREYGVTSEMLGFFNRSYEGNDVVRYEGVEPLSYVLGSYTVQVKDGMADVSWSWDGSPVGSGFSEPAWGAEQLEEMCRLSRESHNHDSSFYDRARAIAKANGVAITSGPAFSESEIKALSEKERRDAEKARSAAKLTPAEMEAIAREAVCARYDFDEDQAKHLACDEDSGRYALFGSDETPCCKFRFSLGFDEDGYQGSAGKGIYTVMINVENGTVEDILYDSAVGGMG